MDYERLLPILELAMAKAREKWDKAPDPPDDFCAFCVLNEIRRAGFRIVPVE